MPPTYPKTVACAANALALRKRLGDRLPALQAARTSLTTSSPSLFKGVTPQERALLATLVAGELELVRLVLELFESAD